MNESARRLCQRSFGSKVIVQKQGHTHIGPVALRGPLKLSVNMYQEVQAAESTCGTDRHVYWPIFNDNFGKPTRERSNKTNLGFTEARDDDVVVESAGPYANHLHLAADR